MFLFIRLIWFTCCFFLFIQFFFFCHFLSTLFAVCFQPVLSVRLTLASDYVNTTRPSVPFPSPLHSAPLFLSFLYVLSLLTRSLSLCFTENVGYRSMWAMLCVASRGWQKGVIFIKGGGREGGGGSGVDGGRERDGSGAGMRMYCKDVIVHHDMERNEKF